MNQKMLKPFSLKFICTLCTGLLFLLGCNSPTRDTVFVNPVVSSQENQEVIICDQALMESKRVTWSIYLIAGVIITLIALYLVRQIRGLHGKQALIQHPGEDDYHQLAEAYVSQSPILQEIKELIATHRHDVANIPLLTPPQWEKIHDTLNTSHHNFVLRLQDQHPDLKEEDLQFCCLIKLGLKYAEIGILLGRTRNMMYKRKNMVTERLHLAPEKNIDLPEYLSRF